MQKPSEPIAVILGDIDMLRPLGMAGVPCAVVAGHGDLPRYSRYARYIIEWSDPWKDSEELVGKLLEFGRRQKTKPVLIYQSDADLLLISRNRHRLSEFFRFVIPEAELTERLVNKKEFHKLAEDLSLPVPKTRLFEQANHEFSGTEFDLDFPVIIKPLTRKSSEWSPLAGLGKAVRVENIRDLERLKNTFDSKQIDGLIQELIPGEESAIESYHVYVDRRGEIAGEFTGKKIRTYPEEFGQSCALTISEAEDITQLGRELVRTLNFRGVAKFDFKRSPTGKIYLLEVNPRFSLWHHLGAAGGLNLPMLVYCDLIGRPRPVYPKARTGTNWCRVWQDYYSAKAAGIPFFKWLRWAGRCEAKPGLSLTDPLPLLKAAVWRALQKYFPGSFFKHKMRVRAAKLPNV